jgi:hypothetical protein
MIPGTSRVVNHIVPPDRHRQYFAVGRRQIADAGKRVETVLDVCQIVIVAAWRRIGSDEIIVGHGA